MVQEGGEQRKCRHKIKDLKPPLKKVIAKELTSHSHNHLIFKLLLMTMSWFTLLLSDLLPGS